MAAMTGQVAIIQMSVVLLEDGRFQNDKDVARYIGCSPATLRTWRVQGRGPKYVKRGRVWYWREHVDEWLRDAIVNTGA